MNKTTRQQIRKKYEESEEDDFSVGSESVKKGKKRVAPKTANRHHLPMLAYDYNKKKDKAEFPCFVQPKLDGVRALFYNGKFYSRNGNQFFDLDHIKDELTHCDKLILDGELYTGDIKFEELVGLVKKQTKSEEDKKRSEAIKYVVYDHVDQNDTFSTRHFNLNQFFDQKDLINCYPLMTEECKSAEELKKFHDKYVKMGYEGLIIRNKKGLYVEKDRSNDLLKYKEFKDDEFEIVDYKSGEGKDQNAVIWICKTKDGKVFSARPDGPAEERRKLYRNGNKYIGKMLTVKYQNLSKDGIPRFPIGIAIRDYE